MNCVPCKSDIDPAETLADITVLAEFELVDGVFLVVIG